MNRKFLAIDALLLITYTALIILTAAIGSAFGAAVVGIMAMLFMYGHGLWTGSTKR